MSSCSRGGSSQWFSPQQATMHKIWLPHLEFQGMALLLLLPNELKQKSLSYVVLFPVVKMFQRDVQLPCGQAKLSSGNGDAHTHTLA